MPDEVQTIKEVAALLKLAEKTFYGMASAGEIPSFKIRGQWHIKRADLDQWTVLGDAELIVGLAARNDGNGALTTKHMGAIDSRCVRELVEEVLEGGRRAFELRRQKYGF